ncbi:hypothetical protein CNX70_19080 [Janthinobacterium svalbardensis]|uniref:Uncharacterized protein n=2 Tax=Janthinobacterium svalbardensis TaxID=368607 RepID=A0A290WYS2_9BURK|nr:hypothetical protein CNX70_19080 [Janthinobacterium svalbardensis]
MWSNLDAALIHPTGSHGMKNSIEDGCGEHVRTDKVMAELVERGVAFHHALGRTVATAYLREHAVPAEVIRRVFSSVQARRPARPARRRWR